MRTPINAVPLLLSGGVRHAMNALKGDSRDCIERYGDVLEKRMRVDDLYTRVDAFELAVHERRVGAGQEIDKAVWRIKLL